MSLSIFASAFDMVSGLLRCVFLAIGPPDLSFLSLRPALFVGPRAPAVHLSSLFIFVFLLFCTSCFFSRMCFFIRDDLVCFCFISPFLFLVFVFCRTSLCSFPPASSFLIFALLPRLNWVCAILGYTCPSRSVLLHLLPSMRLCLLFPSLWILLVCV